MKIKRIAAILLVFAILTTTFTAAKAQEAEIAPPEESTTAIFETETTETTQPPEENGESTTAPEEIPEESEPAVAQMSICMRTTGFPAYFHVWIYVHNISEETLKVGAYDLPADEGVSVGAWGMMLWDKWGVFYNRESYASRDRTADDYYSLTKEITLQELETVSKEIVRWNYWDAFFNCIVFACRLWDCVEGDFILHVPFPLITLLQMAIHGAERNALEMFIPDEERVYRQVGSGEEATLEKVDSRSLDSMVASL